MKILRRCTYVEVLLKKVDEKAAPNDKFKRCAFVLAQTGLLEPL